MTSSCVRPVVSMASCWSFHLIPFGVSINVTWRASLQRRKQLQPLSAPLRAIANISDTSTLVEAISHFQGKTKPEVLRIFQDLEGIDAHCEEHVKLLAAVLFDPRPDWAEGFFCQVKFIDGQPWLLDRLNGSSYSVLSGPVRPYLNWLEREGHVRNQIIRPTRKPWEIVDGTPELALPQHQARRQAWRLVRHLFDVQWQAVFEDAVDDGRWEQFKKLATFMRIDWDDRHQAYRAGVHGPLPAPPVDWLPMKTVQPGWNDPVLELPRLLEH